MPEKTWIRVPDDSTLTRVEGWKKLGDKRYSALRFHLLIVVKRDDHTQSGPSFFEYEVPARATYNYKSKKVSLIEFSSTIQESIKTAVSTKLSEEISTKLASELGLGGGALAAKLQSEVQAKSVSEVSESLGKELGYISSYKVQEARELENSISIAPSDGKGAATPLLLYFFLRLWPWRWDVYLHKVEYLQLEYTSRFFQWWQSRDTLVEATYEPNLHLCQIVYYQPQDEPSLREGSYTPEIRDVSPVLINPPTPNTFPRTNPDQFSTLYDLARLAFPVTSDEKKAAKKAVKRPTTGASGGGGRSVPAGYPRRSSGSKSGGSKSAKGGAKGGGIKGGGAKGGFKGGSKGGASKGSSGKGGGRR